MSCIRSGSRNLKKPTPEKSLEKYSGGVIYECKNMAQKQTRNRRIRMYAFKGQYPPGQERLEINHLPGMRRSVLGDSAFAEHQTVRPNTKSAVYILRTEERSKLMEIKYADNVTLTVEITDQMVKDFKRCQEMVKKVNCDGMDCNSCSNNIDILDGFGLCDVPEVREELERRAKND